jgi:hypothetical protein
MPIARAPRWSVGMLVVITLLAALIAPQTSAAARFSTYVACSAWRQQADPDGKCFGGDAFGAVLRSFHHYYVNYRVCVVEPNANRRCKERETGAPGVRSRVTFVPHDGMGTYVFYWKVRGQLVDRDRIYLAPEGV